MAMQFFLLATCNWDAANRCLRNGMFFSCGYVDHNPIEGNSFRVEYARLVNKEIEQNVAKLTTEEMKGGCRHWGTPPVHPKSESIDLSMVPIQVTIRHQRLNSPSLNSVLHPPQTRTATHGEVFSGESSVGGDKQR
jgi:hypothetical protein